MSKKKFGIFVVLAGLILLVLLLTSPLKTQNIDDNTGKIEKVVKKELKGSVSTDDKETLRETQLVIANKVLAEFFINIDDKQYDKAYSMLDETYKKDFNITKETFILRYEFDSPRTFYVTKINDTSYKNKIIADVSIGYQNEDDGQGSINRKFTINIVDDGVYTIADEAILNSVEYNETKELKPDVEATLIKTYETVEGLIVILNINNKSSNIYSIMPDIYGFYVCEEEIKYPFKNLNFVVDNFNIYAGENKIYYLLFQNTYEPDYIGLLESNNVTSENINNNQGIEIRLFDFK